MAQVFIKLSIITFLRKLLGPIRKWQITTTLLMVFTVLWGLVAFFLNIFQCHPPRFFWMRQGQGGCIAGQTAFYVSIAAISLAEDIVLLLLPIVVVWRLRLSMKKKLHTTMLFAIGSLWVVSSHLSSFIDCRRYRVCIFSLLRLLEFHKYLTNQGTGESKLPHSTMQADPKCSQWLQRSVVDST